jgi:hypothetical protein
LLLLEEKKEEAKTNAREPLTALFPLDRWWWWVARNGDSFCRPFFIYFLSTSR